MIGILGTELRTKCECDGTGADLREMYDCIGWKRLLWVNPCVVEAQKAYHRMEGNFRSTPGVTTLGSGGLGLDRGGGKGSTGGGGDGWGGGYTPIYTDPSTADHWNRRTKPYDDPNRWPTTPNRNNHDDPPTPMMPPNRQTYPTPPWPKRYTTRRTTTIATTTTTTTTTLPPSMYSLDGYGPISNHSLITFKNRDSQSPFKKVIGIAHQ